MRTWEMIKELTNNPKLKATDDEGYIIKCDNDGFFISENGDAIFSINDEWKIIEEPVTWQEAILAWLEGKEVYFITYKGEKIQFNEGMAIYKDDFSKSKWFIEN